MALTNGQLTVISCGIAVQAFILVLLNTFVAQVAGVDQIWIAFQAWAMYFLAGCTIVGGIRAFIGYVTGVIASILIILVMGLPGISNLPSVEGMNFVMATAVCIIVIPAIFLSEKLKNFIPALFVGSGAFFALATIEQLGAPDSSATFLSVSQGILVYCAFGLIFGFITVLWRGAYEASLNRNKS